MTFAQSNGQIKVDSGNYYDYYSSGKGLKKPFITTMWLNVSEVVPILKDEMTKTGLEWVSLYPIYQLKTGQYIQLAAYSRKSNVGFLFIESHSAFPEKKDRRHLTEDNFPGVEYTQVIETYKNDVEVLKINKLPQNIFLLNANCYWYQSTGDKEDDAKLVSKEIIMNILRQDIRHYLMVSDLKTRFKYKDK